MTSSAEIVDALALMAAGKLRRPSESYCPNPTWQRAFHESSHRFRLLFLGNRSGKTTGMGVEADMTLQGSSRFNRTRPTPAQVWWIAPQLRQFDELKAQMDRDFLTQGYAFNASDLTMTWENGSRMTVWPADRDPHYIQGPNPDMVCCDEEPPEALWTELNARGFGAKRTRYIIAATATGGMTWMYDKLYLPWLRYHEALGLDEDRAMAAQKHPDFWVWPKGGIYDNPSIPKATADEFARQDWGGPKQAKVRVFGGFSDWFGDSVFDSGALGDARKDTKPGEIGSLVVAPEQEHESDGPGALALRADALAPVRAFRLSPLSTEGGRLEVWERPIHGRLYVIGADFAYGLEGRDWDTACVLRVPGSGERPEQVAEAQGHWGPDFERVLYAMLRFYNDAYLLGEAQVGLMTLRRLKDEYQYTRMFSERTEAGRERKPGDRLGYHTGANDVTLPKLRRTVLDRAVRWRSAPLVDQMGRLQFRPSNERMADKAMDANLRVKLAGGGSPDLVRAAGFAVHALGEVVWEAPEMPVAPPGSLGDILGFNATMRPNPKVVSWVKKR